MPFVPGAIVPWMTPPPGIAVPANPTLPPWAQPAASPATPVALPTSAPPAAPAATSASPPPPLGAVGESDAKESRDDETLTDAHTDAVLDSDDDAHVDAEFDDEGGGDRASDMARRAPRIEHRALEPTNAGKGARKRAPEHTPGEDQGKGVDAGIALRVATFVALPAATAIDPSALSAVGTPPVALGVPIGYGIPGAGGTPPASASARSKSGALRSGVPRSAPLGDERGEREAPTTVAAAAAPARAHKELAPSYKRWLWPGSAHAADPAAAGSAPAHSDDKPPAGAGAQQGADARAGVAPVRVQAANPLARPAAHLPVPSPSPMLALAFAAGVLAAVLLIVGARRRRALSALTASGRSKAYPPRLWLSRGGRSSAVDDAYVEASSAFLRSEGENAV